MAFCSQPVLTEDQVLLIAKALADPRRYEILKRISNGRGTTACAALLEETPVAPATLSHHMKELETAGLIRATRDGKFMHYDLQKPVLRAYFARIKSDLI